MFSRRKILVQMALEKPSQTDGISSPRIRINLTLLRSKVVSGPAWSDRGHIPPNIMNQTYPLTIFLGILAGSVIVLVSWAIENN